ncbi:riboflavin biosynthesis protein RibF (riboflavin kinase/FMN adenylyltransferase) [Legionella geestiana]|uniref:Riboflavin biosynthesis protein n=2 Tax=Legionella geestiana TaxID=45065 RepID=A0A0W0TW37_9GAMM|nr:bifunctional riboflavin kinase/FAD synthetase [Legionella geestiana]KTC99678.1 riboflavin biosynthesis protein RibF (riboflavin kinase/FMN adenylyltransferase) [Legionella geestiana]STX54279.1 riboflavin biosynthesis protein RibF (riboflavin kinase/FMN adenylyltransferase) [Legionella geestiana]
MTIGTFDGVHRGHQALLSRLSERARAMGLPSVVVVFEPQPAEYLYPDRAPPRLTTLREKLNVFQEMGIDHVCCLRFNSQLASLSFTEFAEQKLFQGWNARHIIVGRDFRFGRNREGGVEELALLAKARAATTEVFEDFTLDGERVSSTRIRAAEAAGDLILAEHLLGRPASLEGRVVRGHGRGATWGFPTANIALSRKNTALRGVFCVWVQGVGDTQLPGVANLGMRPTVDGKRLVLEVHLLHPAGNLYGKRLNIAFVHKLRDEMKFDTIDDLIARIRADALAARAWFAGLN